MAIRCILFCWLISIAVAVSDPVVLHHASSPQFGYTSPDQDDTVVGLLRMT
jgi:hypothetical protein